MKAIILLCGVLMACGAGESVPSDIPDANNDVGTPLVCAPNCGPDELNPNGDACTCRFDASIVEDASDDVNVVDANVADAKSSCTHDASKCDDDDKDCDDNDHHHHHLQWHGPF